MVTLKSGSGSAFLRGSGFTLTNTANTIQGAGNIGDSGALAIVNKATIDANASGQNLNVNQGNGGVTNTGTLEATNGGTLNLFNTITNTGGAITASGTGSTVNIDDATVVGGTLNTASGGLLQTVGTSTLNGVTISDGLNLHDWGRRDDGPQYLPRQRRDVPHRRLGRQRDRQPRQQRYAVGRRHGRYENGQRHGVPARQRLHADQHQRTRSRARAISATAARCRSSTKRRSTPTSSGQGPQRQRRQRRRHQYRNARSVRRRDAQPLQ